jgi:hypothetical protein
MDELRSGHEHPWSIVHNLNARLAEPPSMIPPATLSWSFRWPAFADLVMAGRW